MKPITDSSSCFQVRKTKPAHLAVALLCAPFWACGGGSSSPSTPTPVAVATPQPCAQAILFQGGGEMPAGAVLSLGLFADVPARFDLASDWTFASNPVGLYLVQGECGLSQFNARSCTFVLRVEPGAKPQKGSANVTPGVPYHALLANFGTRDDSGTLQIVRSTGSCPAVAAGPASSASTVTRTVDRMERFGQ